MSTPGASSGQLSRLVRGLPRGRFALWSAFALVHLWLGLLGLYADGYPLGDISLYRFWAEQALFAGHWVGIDTVWVYPVVALVPILIAAVFGTALYASTWLSLVTVLDAAALVAITGLSGEPRNLKIGWWWLGFLLLLGPIALGRIDSVTVPLAIVGVLMIAARPRAAAILLTVAAWIKVWPAAIVAAIVISARTRWRVLAAALGTSAIIVAGALLLGSGTNVFSFVTEQNARGLQFEAPVSTPWLWQAYAHTPGAFAYYDTTLFTWQVHGDGVALVSSLMMPLLLLACTALVLLALLAVTRGADVAAVLPALVLALVTRAHRLQQGGFAAIHDLAQRAGDPRAGGTVHRAGRRLSGCRRCWCWCWPRSPSRSTRISTSAAWPEPGDAHAADRPQCARRGAARIGRRPALAFPERPARDEACDRGQVTGCRPSGRSPPAVTGWMDEHTG